MPAHDVDAELASVLVDRRLGALLAASARRDLYLEQRRTIFRPMREDDVERILRDGVRPAREAGR